MTTRSRSIESIVEEQGRRWGLRRVEPRESRRPVIALSRQYGAGGEELARRLADALSLDLFDREILHQIAESAHLREEAVGLLDERERSVIEEWLSPFSGADNLTHYEYLHHLILIVSGISRRGGAVLVGRGAHLLVRAGEALRVLVVAPLDARVGAVAAAEAIDARDARGRIAAVEAERGAFLKKYFRAKPDDPEQFDLVVNTNALGMEGSLEAVRGAFLALPAPTSS